MEFLHTIQQKIDDLDTKTFRIYAAIAGGLFCALAGIIIFRNYRAIQDRKLKLNYSNEQREELNSILTRYEQVKQQKAVVDAVLAQDPDFIIKEYVDTILQQQNLTASQSQQAELAPQEELENGYTEIKLYLRLTGLNMQSIVQLLDALEKNSRIYTKDLEIYTTSNSSSTVSLNLLLATLQRGV
jgi:hypothetical protein